MNIFNDKKKSVFAVEPIKPEETRRYGIVSGKSVTNDLILVKDLIEKPEPEDAPSLLGILGRYIFTPDIFKYQNKVKSGVGGEIQLTDAMQALSQASEMYSWTFSGKRYDIGTMNDWFKSHLELSLDTDFNSIIREVVK